MDDKARVRERADILEVVGAHVVLKKSGRGYIGLCPFHNERHPSFSVLPEQGIFKCFTCDKKGDVFTFVMLKEGLDFRGALVHLAERCGVTLSAANPEQADLRRQAAEAMEQAARFFQGLLAGPAGSRAREYVKSRGLASDSLERFGIGVAPAEWDGLSRQLSSRGFAPEVLEAAGLTLPGQRGWRDMFRDRLMFPICSDMGTVIAFGGRALSDENPPKYLNSPETVLYQKSQVLFGLHLAKAEIKQLDQAIIVEGYMDVVSLHQAGFRNAVGVLGTALTPSQARSLLRHTPSRRVVVCFDSDRAGQAAAERGASVLQDVATAAGLVLSILAVPDGKDPDAYLKSHGGDAFAQLVREARGVIDFQIDRELSRSPIVSPQDKADAVKRVVPILARLQSPALAEPYLRDIARRLGLNELHLQLDIAPHLRYSGAPRYVTRTPAVAHQRLAEAERGLVCLMVESSEMRTLVPQRLGDIALPTPAYQALRERLVASSGDDTSWSHWLSVTEGSPEHEALVDLSFSPQAQLTNQSSEVMEHYVAAVSAAHWEGEVARLKAQLTNRELVPEEVERVFQDLQDALVQVQGHRARLSGRAAVTGS